ncbi:MAG: GAF domain-containing protein [Anaerolineales bacterium]|nr:GAF domain-containing protein [Anaerolineales bacterium]
MGQAINATSAYLSVVNPDSSWTVLADYYGPEASPQERDVSDVGQTYFPPENASGYMDILAAGQIEIFHQDDPTIHEPIRKHLQQFGIQSVLLIPLRIGGQLVAFADLWDSRQQREFSPEEIGLCRAIAQQAAVAIQNAQLHQQTQQQARQIQHVLDAVRAGIVLLDSDYRVKLANPAGQAHLAVLAGIEAGQKLTHLAEHPLAEVLLPPQSSLWHEIVLPGRMQQIFRVYTRPVVAASAETEGWVIVIHDITEEREAQQRQQQQEKLAAIGQLAAGIAHDFNNILTGIIGFAELARHAPDVPAPVREDLGHIVRQGQRAAQLVRQLLDFARKNVVTKRPLDLGLLLEDLVERLGKTIPANVQLGLKLTPPKINWRINMDPGLIQQVLINLAVNATEAMPQGGHLQFTLSDFTLGPEQHPPCAEMQPGHWLALAVTDTGIGMSPEVKKHLFEPFFTTKEVGQGPGLGLAQVEGIVKQHQGYIQVESQVSRGTTVTLYFPALS